jgi:coenzyme F420 biosynthesis associated uncharacterized protein
MIPGLVPPHAAEGSALDVDWELAGRWGGRLASPGPTASPAELADMVTSLHAAARRARPLAIRVSGLRAAVIRAGRLSTYAQVLVVDRPGWARGAAQSFEALTGPVLGTVRASSPLDAVRTAPATAQAAALLGLLAGRVLGQFDPFVTGATPAGRLMLVAPNVLRTERSLAADPADFRLWVCIHEQTHALQFAAAPWLAEHLRAQVAALVEQLASASPGHEVTAALEAAAKAARSRRTATEDDIGGLGLLEMVLDAEQRRQVEEITAVMSLLEGHADVTMDAVGPRTIPSVRRLRARFEAKRRAATGVDRILRRLLGMDAKLAQYRRGAQFVRTVRQIGGPAALDSVWTSPETLPTAAEIADPARWVARVVPADG